MKDSLLAGTSAAPRPGLDVTSLGSGSSGNAFLVRAGGTTLLVDCGVSIRRVSQGLRGHGLGPTDIAAILISHEHIDHVRELPRLASFGANVFSTAGTAAALTVPTTRLPKPGQQVQIGDVEVFPLAVSHDANEPCGFFLRTAAGAVTILTDLGCPAPAAAEVIAESDLVVIEANHDREMLVRGPYPHHLQRRILSDVGHLSNEDCADLLVTALGQPNRLPTIWLAHLSETNNRPHLALRSVERRLTRAGLHLDVRALPRREASETWSCGERRAVHAQLMLDFSL